MLNLCDVHQIHNDMYIEENLQNREIETHKVSMANSLSSIHLFAFVVIVVGVYCFLFVGKSADLCRFQAFVQLDRAKKKKRNRINLSHNEM